MDSKAKSIGYWVATALIVLSMASGGLAELTQQPDTIAGMKQLGYPAYFIVILGVWKLLGSLALLVPGWPRLKEWAYAGIFFNLTGAALSHIACGSATWHVVVTLTLALIALASWALRPASRRMLANC